MRKLLLEMILDLKKCPCTFTFMHFQIGALPQVQNHFQKQFSHKVLHNYCSTFFLSVSVCIKKWIFHCISKNGFGQCRG